MKRVFFCADQPEAILTAIYDAWADPLPNRDIRIEVGEAPQLSFLEEKVPVEPSYEKAEKVSASVKRKLGWDTWTMAEGALLAAAPDKGDAVFRFFQYAFSAGRDVTHDLAEPAVLRCFELNRKARGEAHLLLGFVRFTKLANGAFFAKIGPINDVLPLIADHFAGRFNTQAFMIYDEKRGRSVVYAPGTDWYLLEGEIPFPQGAAVPGDEYVGLWRNYFNVIAIKERKNYRCQRGLCPIHFRAYMTEF